jgi:hypothetical protein
MGFNDKQHFEGVVKFRVGLNEVDYDLGTEGVDVSQEDVEIIKEDCESYTSAARRATESWPALSCFLGSQACDPDEVDSYVRDVSLSDVAVLTHYRRQHPDANFRGLVHALLPRGS